MKAVCDKYGALLILDEIMCGMGRSGTTHAWEQEGVVPDMQTIGKGLGGGYAPVAALLIHPRVTKVLAEGSGAFMHGQTYQGHPISCAAALEVQRIIREENLLRNVREMGELMESLLRKELSGHQHVGDIRGRGLFWGVSLFFYYYSFQRKETLHIVGCSTCLLTGNRSSLFATKQPRSHLTHLRVLRWQSMKKVGLFFSLVFLVRLHNFYGAGK